MTVKVIPLEVTYAIPGPESIEVRMGRSHLMFDRIERQAKDDLAREIMKHVHTEDFSLPTRGEKYMRMRVFLADGWGSIEAEARRVVETAHRQAAEDRSLLSMWESNLRRQQEALQAAQAGFRESFQNAIEEFCGYDECVGRR